MRPYFTTRIRQADLISSLTNSIIGKDENAALHDIAWYCGDPVAIDSLFGVLSPLNLGTTPKIDIVVLLLDDADAGEFAADHDSDDADADADADAGAGGSVSGSGGP